MFFRLFKNYMPRGIYARAALILVLPVLLLQLLVSVVFIQRHFEEVTELMTSAANIELRFLQATVNAATNLQSAQAAVTALGQPLEIDTELPATNLPPEDIKPSIDLTGWPVIETLRAGVPEVIVISLEDRSHVALWVETKFGPLEMIFERRRVSARNPHQLLVIMVVMGAIMTAVAYFFLRNQLRPIKRLATAAADYGKGRITKFTPTGAVEVRAAGMAFLDMRNRLERHAHSRTMMLSGVSHDLRTPLTRLRLGLAMMDSDEVEPLLRDVEDMEHMVDAFLNFARSDAEDDPEPTIPQHLVEDLVKNTTHAGQAVKIGELSGPYEPIALRPFAIRRALNNLISNSLRYGTRAEIGVSVTERAVRFYVDDDGPGIPADKREDAISPFVRLDMARNQDEGSGVGLGLSIVADIARTHGGVLRLGESDKLGGLRAELVLAR